MAYDRNTNMRAAALTVRLNVGGQQLETLKGNYQNPFSRSLSNGYSNMYVAAKLPAALVKGNNKFVTVNVSNGAGPDTANYHEIGTHDLS